MGTTFKYLSPKFPHTIFYLSSVLFATIAFSACNYTVAHEGYNIPAGFEGYEVDESISEVLSIQYKDEFGIRVLRAIEKDIKKTMFQGKKIFYVTMEIKLQQMISQYNGTNKSEMKSLKGENHIFEYWEFETVQQGIPTYMQYGGIFKKESEEYIELMIYGHKDKKGQHLKKLKMFLTSFDTDQPKNIE